MLVYQRVNPIKIPSDVTFPKGPKGFQPKVLSGRNFTELLHLAELCLQVLVKRGRLQIEIAWTPGNMWHINNVMYMLYVYITIYIYMYDH